MERTNNLLFFQSLCIDRSLDIAKSPNTTAFACIDTMELCLDVWSTATRDHGLGMVYSSEILYDSASEMI